MKRLLGVMLLFSLGFINNEAKDLSIQVGTYALEPGRNITHFEASQRPDWFEIAGNALFGRMITSDKEETLQVDRIVGEKPRTETEVKLRNNGNLKVAFTDCLNSENLKYGSVTLGESKQVFNLAVAGNTLFFDQNEDQNVQKNEIYNMVALQKTTVFQNIEDKNGRKKDVASGVEYEQCVVDIPVKLKYCKNDGRIVEREIFLSFYITQSIDAEQIVQRIRLKYEVQNYFTGTVAVRNRNKISNAKFILVDQDNNGIFNETGKERIYMMLSDKQQKVSFLLNFQIQPENRRVKLHLFSYPRNLVVTENDAPSPESKDLEPEE